MATGVCAYGTSLVTLTDLGFPNSSVTIDPYSQAGMLNWVVETYDQMATSSYWYRIGSTGVAAPISSIGTADVSQLTPGDATIIYSSALFDLQVDYTLWGGMVGSGMSDVSETVKITNKTGTALNFYLFEFVNMDLNGTAAGETATLTNSSTVVQSDGATEGQLSVNTIPNCWEIGDAATLQNKISSVSGLSLSNATSPFTGDAAFAFQWGFSVAGNGSVSMSQDKLMMGAQVPEPSCLAMFTSLFGIVPILRRRHR